MALPNDGKFYTNWLRMLRLYQEDELGACIALGEEMIGDEEIPVYIHIKALMLLGTVLENWEDAEKKRIEAELMFHFVEKLHHSPDDEEVKKLFAGLRIQLNLLENQLEPEKPKGYDSRAAVIQALENRYATNEAQSDSDDDQSDEHETDDDQTNGDGSDGDQGDDDHGDDDHGDDDQIHERPIATTSSDSETDIDNIGSATKSAQIDSAQSPGTSAVNSNGENGIKTIENVPDEHFDEVAVLNVNGDNGMKNMDKVTKSQIVNGQADKIAVPSVHGVNGSGSTESSNRIQLDNARNGSDNEVSNRSTEPRGDESSQVVGEVDSVAAVQVSQLSTLFRRSTEGRPWWRNLPH